MVFRWLRAPRRWLLPLMLVVVSFAGGAMTTHVSHASGRQDSPYAPLAQLGTVLVFVENQYVDPVEREKILDGAIKGMVAELDPHSAYMPPRDFALFNEDTQGAFGGIGVEVDFKDDQIVVIAPIPDTPAQRGGIKSGDRIVAVDGKPLRGVAMDKIIRLMRGPVKTLVKVSVKREGVPDLMHFDLVREHIKVKSVEQKVLSEDIAYIRLKQFQQGTTGELLAAVGEIKSASDPKGVVLDMRNNPGGLIDEAEAIANEFLTSGVIYSTRHRGKVLDEVRARLGGSLTTMPVVVLVNEYSASSAELVAGALQDHGRASIMGATTFGKGSVQTIFQLPGGAGLRLTTMRYYTPKGRAIQVEGVAPDVLIEYEEQNGSEALVLRESSLEGHLAAEAQRKAQPGAKVFIGKKPPAYTPIGQVPVDPKEGDDFALQIAHRALTVGL